MNRYISLFIKLFFSALLLGSMAAQAGVRNFPDNAERGELRVQQGLHVTLNGNKEQMAPGVLIKSTSNTTVVPMSLVGRTHVVNFTRNGQGKVDKVWLLNLAEAKQPAPKKTESKGILSQLFSPSEPPKDDGNTPYHQLPKYGQ